MVAPGVREEIEARPGSVASCPQVVDEILASQSDEQELEDYPKGLKSERRIRRRKII